MVRTFTLATALLLALTLAGVRETAAQTKDDTVVYALQSDVDTWDPPNSVLREAIILGYNVFDHLGARDLKTRKVGPGLAIAWKALDDTTWEVKLRQGVKFHDGSPFTAKDVKASFERLTALPISSEKAMREKGHEWMQEHPVGTGPYKLVKWDRKQEHLLVRNDDYWGPKPAFKYVRIRIIPEQATQIAELMAG